jgi:hypothetical protein
MISGRADGKYTSTTYEIVKSGQTLQFEVLASISTVDAWFFSVEVPAVEHGVAWTRTGLPPIGVGRVRSILHVIGRHIVVLLGSLG